MDLTGDATALAGDLARVVADLVGVAALEDVTVDFLVGVAEARALDVAVAVRVAVLVLPVTAREGDELFLAAVLERTERLEGVALLVGVREAVAVDVREAVARALGDAVAFFVGVELDTVDGLLVVEDVAVGLGLFSTTVEVIVVVEAVGFVGVEAAEDARGALFSGTGASPVGRS